MNQNLNLKYFSVFFIVRKSKALPQMQYFSFIINLYLLQFPFPCQTMVFFILNLTSQWNLDHCYYFKNNLKTNLFLIFLADHFKDFTARCFQTFNFIIKAYFSWTYFQIEINSMFISRFLENSMFISQILENSF